MSIEWTGENECVIHSKGYWKDRKYVITKPTKNYRVEKFEKRSEGHFGRLLNEKGNLRYFETKELAIAHIERINDIIGS